MNELVFYALYQPADNEGPPFVSEGQASALFSPNVFFNGKNYRLQNTFQIGTPTQQKNFEEYCAKNNLESVSLQK